MRTGEKNFRWLCVSGARCAWRATSSPTAAKPATPSSTHDAVPTEKISVIHNSLVFPPVNRPPPLLAQRGPLHPSIRPQTTAPRLNSAPASTPPKQPRVLLLRRDVSPRKKPARAHRDRRRPPARARLAALARRRTDPSRAACAASRLVATKNLGARVKFLGFHRDPRPALHDVAADLAVHASWSEGALRISFIGGAGLHGLFAVAYEAQGDPSEDRFGARPHRLGRSRATTVPPSARRSRAGSANPPSPMRSAPPTPAPSPAPPSTPERQVAAYLDLFRRLLARLPCHDQQAAHRSHRAIHPRPQIRRPAHARDAVQRLALDGAAARSTSSRPATSSAATAARRSSRPTRSRRNPISSPATSASPMTSSPSPAWSLRRCSQA